MFLRSVWAGEYDVFVDSPHEASLLKRLHNWVDRKDLKETSAEAAFIEQFFRDTWGYIQSGQEAAFQNPNSLRQDISAVIRN